MCALLMAVDRNLLCPVHQRCGPPGRPLFRHVEAVHDNISRSVEVVVVGLTRPWACTAQRTDRWAASRARRCWCKQWAASYGGVAPSSPSTLYSAPTSCWVTLMKLYSTQSNPLPTNQHQFPFPWKINNKNKRLSRQTGALSNLKIESKFHFFCLSFMKQKSYCGRSLRQLFAQNLLRTTTSLDNRPSESRILFPVGWKLDLDLCWWKTVSITKLTKIMDVSNIRISPIALSRLGNHSLSFTNILCQKRIRMLVITGVNMAQLRIMFQINISRRSPQ